MTSLYDRARLFARLTRVEGRRNKMYKDTKGIWTIGIGHNLEARGVSDAVIDLMLEEDLADFVAQLDRNIPWWRNLDTVRREIMIELCFNMGWGDGNHGLSSFKQTLANIQRGDYAKAAAGLRASKWARDVKEYRAGTLANAMESGAW